MTVVHTPPRRPLLGLAASYALGTAFGLRGASLAWVCAMAVLSGLLWRLAWRRSRLNRRAQPVAAAMVHAMVACVAAMAAAAALRQHNEGLAALREILESGEDVELRGTVVTEPAGSILDHGGARLRFDFRVTEIPDDFGGHRPVPFRIPVDWYGHASILGANPSRPVPRGGEGWCLQGRLRDATLPGAIPRYALSVRSCNRASCRTPPLAGLAELAPPQGGPLGGHREGGALRRREFCKHLSSQRDTDFDTAPWITAGWNIRRHAAEQLAAGIEHMPHAVAVLRAIILGYRAEMPDDLRALFANSGTVHIFAISGMHVVILAGLLVAVPPLTHIPSPRRGWVLGPFLVLYTILTGSSPSAVRACVMSLIFLGAPLVGRKPNAMSALAAAAIGQLAVAPFQLTNLGFLFSFACVIGILVLSSMFNRLWTPAERDATTEIDRLVRVALLASGGATEAPAAAPVRRGRLHALGRFLRRCAVSSLAVSLAAWLASTPLTALHFGRVSPIAILSNLFAIPLSTGIVLCGSLSLVGGLVSPWFSITFNCASLAMIELLIVLTRLTVRLPGATWTTTPWSTGAVILWYLACGVLAVLLHIHLQRREQRAETSVDRRPP